MDKLSGLQYPAYWRHRMAKGPEQASFNGRDAARQGGEIWEFISPFIEDLCPRSILDFGCGYGRMLRRLHRQWPAAKLYGVDLSGDALAGITDCGRPRLSTSIPTGLRVDMIFDCMCLQHVTDKTVFSDTVRLFGETLAASGSVVLFENVAKPGAAHVRDMCVRDYMKLWPELKWTEHGVLFLGYQGHALMIGRRPA